MIKKYLHYGIAGLGLMFICVAYMLRAGSAEVDTVITNVTSTFMYTTGGICMVGALVAFFLRDDETVF